MSESGNWLYISYKHVDGQFALDATDWAVLQAFYAQYGNGNFIEYSIGSRLTFPRFIAPFLSSSFRRRINATSELATNYDLQDRPEFHRRVFSVGWRYKWNDQGHHDRYQVDLLDLNYIYICERALATRTTTTAGLSRLMWKRRATCWTCLRIP